MIKNWIIIGLVSIFLWIILSVISSFFSWIFGGVTSYSFFMIIWLLIPGEWHLEKPTSLKKNDVDVRFLDPDFRTKFALRKSLAAVGIFLVIVIIILILGFLV